MSRKSRQRGIEELSPIELTVLRALAQIHREGGSKSSDAALRHALRAANEWDEKAEVALCDGDEDGRVTWYYAALRKLVSDTSLVAGAGNLRGKAGPRYTACWITAEGLAELARYQASASQQK
jgi:hypothetical protein